MKRRVTQITKVSAKVDGRLKQLELRLAKIEKMVDFIEKQISIKKQTPTTSYTYTITSKKN
ncbi:MAG: hypothetical protein ISR90_06850 [Candidatus Marinimicrobia bacterium]|nr:hypothetical protein [Candidatus Neomarinimicrobiota bacterium]MBL7023749.1 hypothetical protein [Candidatus Neomarinimicrobiota bacterium]